MSLALTTQWTQHNNRTYLVVTVAAPPDIESVATQTYLDIQMPEGTRIRHIGKLTTDGRGRNIGVDVPDVPSAGEQNIVFKVKSRQESNEAIAPELHLHWVDSASGDLMERHQTGTPLPTGEIEADDALIQIVAEAQSEHQPTRRENRRRHSKKENQFMNTETRTRHYRGGHRCHHRRHAETLEGREFGARAARAGKHGRRAFAGMERGHRHGHRRNAELAGPPIIQEMRMQIHDLERRVRRLQRRAKHEAMSPENRITRHPRRRPDADFIPARHHLERRMHAEGRRMGRMMRRAWYAREERHHDL